MHPHFADGVALVPRCLAAALQVGVGLTSDGCDASQEALQWQPLWLRLWRLVFSQPGRRSGRYVHPVEVAHVPTRSGPQVTNQGYHDPGLSQFIW